MKTTLLVLATVAISGCAVYPATYDTYGTGSVQPYGVVQPSVSIYGVYGYDRDGRAYTQPRPRPRGRDQDRDGIPNRVDRDRDGDGVPNRVDRDRDGDGVPNRWDGRPNDPRSR